MLFGVEAAAAAGVGVVCFAKIVFFGLWLFLQSGRASSHQRWRGGLGTVQQMSSEGFVGFQNALQVFWSVSIRGPLGCYQAVRV